MRIQDDECRIESGMYEWYIACQNISLLTLSQSLKEIRLVENVIFYLKRTGGNPVSAPTDNSDDSERRAKKSPPPGGNPVSAPANNSIQISNYNVHKS